MCDISSRKQAEAQFRQVVESAPNGMLMIDPLGNITLVNKQVETMFGYSREEMLGKPVEMLIPERFCPDHPAHRILLRPVVPRHGSRPGTLRPA